jgi:transcriptional regulator with XRE-family HTH domain
MRPATHGHACELSGAVGMVAIRPKTLGETIDRLERDLGLSSEELALALGAPVSTVEQWRRDASEPDGEDRQRLDDLMALQAHLHDTLKPEGIPRWLREPNRYISSITKRWTTPVEAIEGGHIDWVDNALGIIDHGIFV